MPTRAPSRLVTPPARAPSCCGCCIRRMPSFSRDVKLRARKITELTYILQTPDVIHVQTFAPPPPRLPALLARKHTLKVEEPLGYPTNNSCASFTIQEKAKHKTSLEENPPQLLPRCFPATQRHVKKSVDNCLRYACDRQTTKKLTTIQHRAYKNERHHETRKRHHSVAAAAGVGGDSRRDK